MGTPERLVPSFIALLVLAGCGGGASPPPDQTIFRVETVTPPDLAEDVALTDEVDIFFSRPVDPATLDFDSLTVLAESGDEIFGQRTVAPLNPGIVRFIPIQSYFPFAVHSVRVTRQVRDRDGNPLDRDYEFRFQTKEADPVLLEPKQVVDLGDLLQAGRWFHRMTLLPSGRFLVAGGYGSDGTVLGVGEHLHPQLPLSQVIPTPMRLARAAHVQVALDDGRVLLAGGEVSDNPFTPTARCEIFDPEAFTFLEAASMKVARSFAEGIRLANGRVLVTGGQTTAPGGVRFVDQAEIYDPATDTWTLLPNLMARPRTGHAMALAPTGEAVLVGGTPGVPSAELFRPALLDFVPSIAQPLFPHFFAASTTLPDGRLFLAGGVGTRGVTIWGAAAGFLQAVNQLTDERVFATATPFADGRVVIAGGTDFTQSPALLRTTLEVFHPIGATGKVFRLFDAKLPRPTSHHAAATALDGSIWITGGLPTDFALPGLRQVVVLKPDAD